MANPESQTTELTAAERKRMAFLDGMGKRIERLDQEIDRLTKERFQAWEKWLEVFDAD